MLTPEAKELFKKLDLAINRLEETKLEFTTVRGVNERVSTVTPTYVLTGGDYLAPGEEVPPGIFTLLEPGSSNIVAPPEGKSTGRRLALANWIASRNNPWTARVIVNRLWHHHFGRGIVSTPDDFGYSGSPPSHPELLDWLAVELMDSGWSLKHIQRLILLSATYRQSSQVNTAGQDADSQNDHLWRQNLRRMDAETIRDSMLSVAGLMRSTLSGPPLWPEVPEEVLRTQPGVFEKTSRLQGYYTSPGDSANVRSIFLVKKRSVPLPFLAAFNQVDGSSTCGRREVTNNAIQALALLNNPLAIRCSRALATRVIAMHPTDMDAQLNAAFRLVFARHVRDEEKVILVQALKRNREAIVQSYPNRMGNTVHDDLEKDVNELALAEVCRALLNSNEFIFIE